MKKDCNSYFTMHNRRRLLVFLVFSVVLITVMCVQLFRIMIFKSNHYGQNALDVQERERSIKAPRGMIYDRNGVVIAGNKPVCSISVIHSQITDAEEVINVLSSKLDIDEATIRKKVEKVSSREKIKSNVDKTIADEIRELNLDGVMDHYPI